MKKKTSFSKGGAVDEGRYHPPLSPQSSMRKCPVASLTMTEGLLLLMLAAVPNTLMFSMMREPGAL